MNLEIGELVYLYCATANMEQDLAFYKGLGATEIWRRQGMGADVAALRFGEGPQFLLADHRTAPSVLPIWAVNDLSAARKALEKAGWKGTSHQVEIPDGPCLLLKDESGNEIALLHRIRPDWGGSGGLGGPNHTNSGAEPANPPEEN